MLVVKLGLLFRVIKKIKLAGIASMAEDREYSAGLSQRSRHCFLFSQTNLNIKLTNEFIADPAVFFGALSCHTSEDECRDLPLSLLAIRYVYLLTPLARFSTNRTDQHLSFSAYVTSYGNTLLPRLSLNKQKMCPGSGTNAPLGSSDVGRGGGKGSAYNSSPLLGPSRTELVLTESEGTPLSQGPAPRLPDKKY